MKTQPRKQHLIDIAYRLFNEYGYHATGIDKIVSESGVSKATLYKHFSSKEELILAVLQQRHQQLMMRIQEYNQAAIQTGEPPALAIFDALHDWFQSETFFGCNVINASAEYSQRNDPIHQFSALHKARMMEITRQLLPEQRQDLAIQLQLLVEGAIVCAHVHGNKNAAQQAKKMALTVLAERRIQA